MTEILRDTKTLKIYAPISGEIQKVNLQSDENSGLLNEDPYGNGWIIKIKPTKWKEETQTLYLAKDAINW